MAGWAAAAGLSAETWAALATPASSLGFALTDVTGAAGLNFHHNSGAYGGKLLPETLVRAARFLTTTRTAGRTFC